MKTLKMLVLGFLFLGLLASPALGQQKTCCQKAIEQKKECSNKCCIKAHSEGKSCKRCNPGGEDAKLIKKKDAKADEKKSK